MAILPAIEEYYKYFHNGDRRGIFKLIIEEFQIEKAIYPGSYIHIAPSFYIPEVVYIDSFKKTEKFFIDDSILELINQNKSYKGETKLRFYLEDFYKLIPEPLSSFDLLISQYSGFVSQCCKKYLKPEGFLVANNSHGDASMVSFDNDFKLIGVIYYSNNKYRYTTKHLEKYFIPKHEGYRATIAYVKEKMKGIVYTKSPSAYIFRKVR
ncbi:MAG: hypothetical protein GF383_11940 [Candidatus Lokiarchaeota archaeon]|nr:hypothetical protein [Candidatus Lokiarchaeota archaeon]MBD3341585.1 hypothetical protein [Candidatus Lokiarchaeota archaeon]